MISVEEATHIVISHAADFGTETIPLIEAPGRILASPVQTDRGLPPFDRVTMDGIAIRWEDYENGTRDFRVVGTQYAGQESLALTTKGDCIEIMTGCALHESADCVIRYEDITLKDDRANIMVQPQKGQNIHSKGSDARSGEILIAKDTFFRTAEIAVAASVGLSFPEVRKTPKVIIISSGDEIVEIDKTPKATEIRNSSAYALSALLRSHGIATDKIHITDDKALTESQVKNALIQYDAIMLCGGVSKGKKDYIPQALEDCGVEKHFHQVSQRPGKPFWFGTKDKVAVFALPGNPVSTFMCARRYFIPWLLGSLQQEPMNSLWAVLAEDYHFGPELSYFLQVRIKEENGRRMAIPVTGGGSGDFSNMLKADGFLELPLQKGTHYKKGEVFRFWGF